MPMTTVEVSKLQRQDEDYDLPELRAAQPTSWC